VEDIMTASATINGVDTAQITTLVRHLTEVPSAGDTTWRAEVTWVDGFRNEVRVRDLSATYVDEPETLGGRNSAPNPLEQLLGALGSCLATGYTANASLRGITIRDLRIELEGHIDLGCFLGLKAGYAGYPEVSVKVNLDADAPAETLQDLHEHVLIASPVGNTIQSQVELKAQLVTNN
jgi:uncharacterized OsmC-like protein